MALFNLALARYPLATGMKKRPGEGEGVPIITNIDQRGKYPPVIVAFTMPINGLKMKAFASVILNLSFS